MHITRVNAAFSRIFKVDITETVGLKLDEVVSYGIEVLYRMIDGARKKNETVQDLQVDVRTRDGADKILRVTAIPLFSEGNKPIEILLVIRDVTQLYTLKSRFIDKYQFSNIIGKSQVMQDVFHLMQEVSETDTSVLITGESGTGKELVASAIHYNGLRADSPFIAINCAALPDNLLDSELFGHTKGAFTGATKDRVGLFEAASGGTLFLDEIGDIYLTMQLKLLRVLQEGEYTRLGESLPRKTDARIIAATNQNLKEKIVEGSFRKDLFYRLNVFTIHLPTLSERIEDVPLMVDKFLQEFNKSLNRNVMQVSDIAMEHLINYPWPGNVRELRNIINGAMILCHGDTLEPRHFHPDFFQIPVRQASSEQVEKSSPVRVGQASLPVDRNTKATELTETLQQNLWNITKTARQLNVSRTHIYKKIKEFDIQIPR